MTFQALVRSGVLFAVASIVSCSSGNPVISTPVSATPVMPPVAVPAPRPAPNTLSGIVFELVSTGRVAIAGAQVYCDGCGSPDGHTFTQTTADGAYSFSWAYDGVVPLLVKKDGYAVVGATLTLPDGSGERRPTVSGDTRFDIELVRR